MLAGIGLDPLLGDQGSDNGVFVLGKALLAELLQGGVGGGLLPAQLFGAQLYQFAGGEGFVFPYHASQ